MFFCLPTIKFCYILYAREVQKTFDDVVSICCSCSHTWRLKV